VQLSLLRYPGYALGTDSEPPEPVILWVAKQVQADPASWPKYGERDVTRREHAQELRTYPTLRPLIGGTLNIKHVRAHWDDILR
jgi:hypothetical protein